MLARALDSSKAPFDAQKLRGSMFFTNDLNRARGQTVPKAFPQLVQVLEEAGYPRIDWTFHWEARRA